MAGKTCKDSSGNDCSARDLEGQYRPIVTKGNSAWRLSTGSTSGTVHFAVTGRPDYHYVDGQTGIQIGRWHHVCACYDGADIRPFIDGKEDPASPVAYAGRITTNEYDVCIGKNLEYPDARGRDGLIDDVRIYNRALTGPGITALSRGEEPMVQGAGNL